ACEISRSSWPVRLVSTGQNVGLVRKSLGTPVQHLGQTFRLPSDHDAGGCAGQPGHGSQHLLWLAHPPLPHRRSDHRIAAGQDQQLQLRFLYVEWLPRLRLSYPGCGLLRRREEEAEARWASQNGERYLRDDPNARSHLRRQGQCQEATVP
ncbi:mCG6608, isoform CRA_a, partial [Mus musculus]